MPSIRFRSIASEGVTEMIRKLVPSPLRRWARNKIQELARQNPLPVAAVNYLPYRHDDDSFVIPETLPSEHEVCSCGLPIPPKRLYLGYGSTTQEYLSSGEKDVARMLELAAVSGLSLAERDRVLDFGCGAGRMIRHLSPLASTCEIWGTDISAECVYWCRQHMDPPFHFVTTIPSLPFEEQYFDLIYAGSVFTHIDDLASAWLLELRRVLSEKGRAYITIHDEHTVKLLDTKYREHPFAVMMRSCAAYDQLKSDFKMIAIGRGFQSNVFYNSDFFSKMLSPMFDVLSIVPEAYGYQTALVVAGTEHQR
jgi:ubiquinone/menaquinone biosynthesis C-methylase UbiE